MRRVKHSQITRAFKAEAYVRPGVSLEEVKEIKEAFDIFDSDQKGFVEVSELIRSMETLGFHNRNPAIYSMVKDIEEEENEFDFQDFLDLVTARISEETQEKDLDRMFKLFDVDRTGEISVDNLKTLTSELGELVSEEDLKEII